MPVYLREGKSLDFFITPLNHFCSTILMADYTPSFKAAILDMDGVITQTARLHAKAWKEMFDAFLEKRKGNDYRPLSIEEDYTTYIDGKPRYEGVRSFLKSRNIEVPEGSPGDAPSEETVYGLGMRKNEIFLKLLDKEGVEVYKDTVKAVKEWREQQIKTAVISSSRNCRYVLEAANLLELFDARVDGEISEEKQLKGKPEPDIFLEATEMLGVEPKDAIVLEDAIAGVQAGKKGKFKLVIGVARRGEDEVLKEHGADIVVNKLSEIEKEMKKFSRGRKPESLPHALEHVRQITESIGQKKPVLFLDYDGTLSPIVKDPDKAILSDKTKEKVRELAGLVPVAVVSGRDRADVQKKVGLENVIYAGSHGFDIEGPNGLELQYEGGQQALPALKEAEKNLNERIGHIKGAVVERKKYAIAVHYRNVADSEVDTVKKAVYEELEKQEKLKKGGGKKIIELKPDIDWNKGRATRWLLEKLELNSEQHIPFFIGDDVTDEDAIEAIADDGIGILVGTHGEKTAASYRLNDTEEVAEFLGQLQKLLKDRNYG